MPKYLLPSHICVILERYGFAAIRQKGSHRIFGEKKGGKIVIVPMRKKEIPIGTFKSILRQSGLDQKHFE